MGKITQKDLLKTEAFSDIIRGVATTIASMAPELSNPLERVIEPFKKGLMQNPLAFLKEKLRYNKELQFVKFIKQTKKQADRTKPWYRRILGPKSVTLIEFIGNVYMKGPRNAPIRGYRGYGMTDQGAAAADQYDKPTFFDRQEKKPFANILASVDNTGKNVIIEAVSQNNTVGGNNAGNTTNLTYTYGGGSGSAPPAKKAAKKRARKTAPTTPEPQQTTPEPQQTTPEPQQTTPEPEEEATQKRLVAEIFRTKDGLQLGELYDAETNERIEIEMPRGGGRSSQKPKASDTLNRLNDKERRKTPPLLGPSDLEDFVKDKFGLDDSDISSAIYKPVKDAITNGDKKELVRALKRVGLVEKANQLTTLQKMQILAEKMVRSS